MQQIADWLEKLGMSEYAQRFAENDIDFTILADLTDQDLEKIGIASLGNRRKILRAIAALKDGSAAAVITPVVPIPVATAPPMPAAEVLGERRYLSVMFCDLVGSTSISAQLDAEEWRDLVGAYLDAAMAAVEGMGGHVAKKLGDGLMALFGYPLAQENDAERAARAALSIQRALAEVNRKNADAGKPALNARIGIESGPVVVDATGEIYGDAPNIAARVQALAEPGTVVMTARVQRQVAGLFVVEERGTHELKGVPEPVTLYRLVRASGGGRRVGQRRLTPLVGREEETAMLMRRWERARQGDGQLVMIVGEPGLGKSRLIEEFHPRLREVPHTWVEWSCSQLLQNTPLHPIADWGRQRFGGADIPAEQRLADLENTLALVKLDPAENAPLLAPLLDIPLPQDRAPTLEPEVLRRRQLTALTNWVMAGARTQPAILALEDVHWADPTTLDVLRGIAERGALAPLLVLITARPEFRPPWGMRSHHSTISLTPLDRSQVRHMVGELAARNALPKEVVDGLTERTGGVPLFVEEVTRLLLERGEQGGMEAIPPTLQQSLMARLDRLGSAREVAQIGAVIGRGFSYPLIRAVADMDDTVLQTALERLAEADILLVQGLPPESEYRFKHVLIQDAAYENLLRSRRQFLHRRVGQTIESRFAEIAESQPELIAQHYTAAAMPEQAIPYWMKAGERALARSAYREPLAYFDRALTLARSLPESPARTRQILDLLFLLGETHSRNRNVSEALQTFKEAFELARAVDSPADLARAAVGATVAETFTGARALESRPLMEAALAALGEAETVERSRLLSQFSYQLWMSGNFERADALSHQALDLARRLGDSSALYHALYCRLLAFTLGEPCPAGLFPKRRRLIAELREVIDQLGDARLNAQIGLSNLDVGYVPAVASLEIGDLADFEAYFERAQKLLDKAQFPGSPPYILTSAGAMRAILHGDFAAAERLAERALEVSHELQREVATGVYGVQMFTTRREQGRLAEVAPLVRRFVEENAEAAAWRPGLALIASDLGFEEAAQRIFDELAATQFDLPIDARRNITLSYLAEICTRLGDADRAEKLYQLLLPYRDLALLVPIATICCGATARYLGMVAGAMGDWAAAEQHFEASLDLDERLQAWPWLTHTKHEFALMLRARGRPGDRDRAAQLLAEAAASAERFGMAALQSKIRAAAK
jgi:class 3 adenylate cyclase/tetratricopeptide (TPR) repeat protein